MGYWEGRAEARKALSILKNSIVEDPQIKQSGNLSWKGAVIVLVDYVEKLEERVQRLESSLTGYVAKEL